MPPSRVPFWDRLAPSYEADNAHVAGADLLTRLRDAVAAEVPGGDVIELGCGTGWFTHGYAPRCRRVLATDLSPAMLAQARDALSGLPHVRLLRADAAATGLPRASTDAVVIANVLDVVPEPGRILAEAARVLRPGGALIVGNFATEGMSARQRLRGGVRLLTRPRLYAGGRHGRFLTRDALAALTRGCGFGGVRHRLLVGESMNALVLRATRDAVPPAG